MLSGPVSWCYGPAPFSGYLMAVYIITGKLGAGKTLAAVARIRDYLVQGRPVATNIDVRPEALLPATNRTARLYRLPDKPSRADLDALGIGNDTYDEDRNGALVLDECGTWFNSRNWQDKARQPVIDWFLHARKLGWDVYLIVQDISIMDKQAREALAEHTVYCRRLDRFRVPFLTAFFKTFLGFDLRLPRVHVAVVKYGDTPQHPTVDRWWYRGDDLYCAYDTKQVYMDRDEGVRCVLTPWHLVGRYQGRLDVRSLVSKWLLLPLALALAPLVYVQAHRASRSGARCDGATPGAVVLSQLQSYVASLHPDRHRVTITGRSA